MDEPAAGWRPADTARATLLLRRLVAGDADAADELLPLDYAELHALAERCMRRERADHTLQPTVLAHDAWLRLVEQRDASWQSREHFLALAARVMRRLLVNHARERAAAKRGGGRAREELEGLSLAYEERAIDLLVLDEALARLAREHSDLARIVELRYFGGLSVEEVARVTATSTRTVERRWMAAHAWLHRELADGSARGGQDGERDSSQRSRPVGATSAARAARVDMAHGWRSAGRAVDASSSEGDSRG